MDVVNGRFDRSICACTVDETRIGGRSLFDSNKSQYWGNSMTILQEDVLFDDTIYECFRRGLWPTTKGCFSDGK